MITKLLPLMALITVIVVAGTSCSAPKTRYPNNIVAVDADGTLRTFYKPKRVKDGLSSEPGQLVKTSLPKTVDQSRNYERTNFNELDFIFWHPNPELDGQSNIVIFIQGGLNDVSSGITRADKLSEHIMKDPKHPAYPIFIAWDANLFSAWTEQYSTHRGQTDKVFGFTLAPFTLIANIGRFVFHSPISVFEQMYAAARTSRTRAYGQGTKPSKILARPELVNQQLERLRSDGFDVQFESGSAKWPRSRAVIMFAEAGPKILSEGVVDTGGKIGWDFMLRRTKTMFTLSNRHYSRGGMDYFAESLADFMELHPEKNLTVVGHSMGSIVANEIIRRYGYRLRIANIVYMAAACGVDDFDHVVIPYLLDHPDTKFYNLSLHPGNDSSELPVPWWGSPIAPRGSLLDWIDFYYSSTDTDYGWTLGKWENAIMGSQRFLGQQTLADETQLKTQVHLKSFGYGPESQNGPQHHGGFDRWEFWNPEFWRNIPFDAGWRHHCLDN